MAVIVTEQAKLAIPVVIVLERREVRGKFWSVPTWSLQAVLVGESIRFNDGAATGDDPGQAGNGQGLSLWPGYSVRLYKDACERYWHALIGERPLVYVVLREDDVDGSVEPALVTIDYDEATAYAETDAQVLSTDIPAELYQQMERFVLDHYQPADFSKRKRKKWFAEDPRKKH